MDDRSFDRLARRIGRRGALAAFAGLVLAAVGGRRSTAARPYSAPLGGACYHDRQRIPAEPGPSENIVSCADNGLGWDAGFNCCCYRGGECRDDGHCCGYLTCTAGSCSSRFDHAGAGPMG